MTKVCYNIKEYSLKSEINKIIDINFYCFIKGGQ